MRKLIKLLTTLLCLVIGCTSVMACGEDRAPADVAVTSISIAPTAVTMGRDENSALTVTVLPENATNKKVTFSSDNESAVLVDSTGTLTALELGVANITATSVSGGKTATCVVTVLNENEIVTGATFTAPAKKEFMLNEPISLVGGKITVTYQDESVGDVALTASGVEISGFDTSAAGVKTVNVTYKGYSFNYEITVTASSLEFVAPTLKQAYRGSKRPNIAGGKFILTENGEKTEIPLSDKKVDISFNSSKVGKTTVSVTYNQGAKFTYEADIINNTFTNDDLTDKDYIDQMTYGAVGNYVVGEKGLTLTDKQELALDINTDIPVYAIKVVVSSENPNTTFNISFDRQANDQCNYASCWRGQKYDAETALHGINGISLGAKAGTFTGYIPLKGNGGDFWGNQSSNIATKLTGKQLVRMTLMAIIDSGADSSSVTFSELSFMTEAEYKDAIKPKGNVEMTKIPTRVSYAQGVRASKIDLAGGVFAVTDDNGVTTNITLPNGKVTVKALDNIGTLSESVRKGSVTLGYAGLEDKEFKYDITLTDNDYSFDNLIDPEYQKDNFDVEGGGAYETKEKKLNITSRGEWVTVMTGVMPGKDTVGFYLNFECPTNHYLFVDIKFEGIDLRFNTGAQAGGKYEGYVLISEMGTPWLEGPTFDPAKRTKVLEGIAAGKPISVGFTIQNEVVSVDVVNFDLINQTEYEKGTEVGSVDFTKNPTKTEYFRGTDKSKVNLTGGEFTVINSEGTKIVTLPSSNVSVVSFDSMGTKNPDNETYTGEIVLKYGDLEEEFKYSVTLKKNEYSFENVLNPDYQTECFEIGNNGTYATVDGKLKLNNLYEWSSIEFNTAISTDAVGMYFDFDCKAGDYVLLSIKVAGETFYFNSGKVASGHFEKFVLFTEFGTPWSPDPQKLDRLAKAVKDGKVLKIGFVLMEKTPRITEATINNLHFVNQADYDAGIAI